MQNIDIHSYNVPKLELIESLQNNELIARRMNCNYCNRLMSLKKTNDSSLGYNWRCENYNCQKYQTTISFFKNSFSEKFKKNPYEILKIIYHLCEPIEISKIVNKGFAGKKTIIAVKKKAFWDVIKAYYASNLVILG